MTKARFYISLMLTLLCITYGEAQPVETYDIVIYGGTSAGVIAAAQASRMGKSVILIEPSNHLGGMTSSGLGWMDANTFTTIGGLAGKHFQRIWEHYQLDSSWIWEGKNAINGRLVKAHQTALMWVLEPHVGEELFDALVAESNVHVLRNERLNRTNGVQMHDLRIVEIAMESGFSCKGKMFIDATYEGDLMAAANISYIVGREPNSRYQETMNGIRPNTLKQVSSRDPYAGIRIDAYVAKGMPQSGLLPRIHPNAGGNAGDGDRGVQAYNYRMCLTDVPENRIQIERPIDYDESQYEIVFRALEAGLPAKTMFKLSPLPNRKTDSNNTRFVSTDYIGMSWNYAEADYATRETIALGHEKWQRGLLWTLQNHPRIPEDVRAYYAPWGLPKDEFVENNHWPYMLYIREARRMISSVVIDENTVLGKVPVLDSVGLTGYSIDSHAIQYIANADGFIETDGGLFKKISRACPISFQAIVPKRNECKNLLVPICVSCSHVAYGAIRMEPVFMILGQSAATAASLAIDLDVAVQNVPYRVLRKQLLADGQVLLEK